MFDEMKEKINEEKFLCNISNGNISDFNDIFLIIELYHYEKAFGIDDITKTENLIKESLKEFFNSLYNNYGKQISSNDFDKAFNIFKNMLYTPENITNISSYEKNIVEKYKEIISRVNEKKKLFNNKEIIKKSLINVLSSNDILDSESFLINFVTFFEDYIAYNFPNIFYTSIETLKNDYKNIENYLTECFKKFLFINNNDKDFSISLINLNGINVMASEDILKLIKNNPGSNDLFIHTLSLNKSSKFLSVTTNKSDFNYKYHTNSIEIYSDIRTTVYDNSSKMIMDYGTTGTSVQECSNLELPKITNQFNMYHLEVMPNGKAHYIFCEDNETIYESFDIDVQYDTNLIDFTNMRQFIGTEASVISNKYESDLTTLQYELGLQNFYKILRLYKIPYLFHESAYKSISKCYDFSIENMWKIISKEKDNAKQKLLYKKYRGSFNE